MKSADYFITIEKHFIFLYPVECYINELISVRCNLTSNRGEAYFACVNRDSPVELLSWREKPLREFFYTA